MTYKERKQKMGYFLEMIEKGRCHSLDQIALKFECSKRTVARMLAELREDGHKVSYSNTSGKFLIVK